VLDDIITNVCPFIYSSLTMASLSLYYLVYKTAVSRDHLELASPSILLARTPAMTEIGRKDAGWNSIVSFFFSATRVIPSIMVPSRPRWSLETIQSWLELANRYCTELRIVLYCRHKELFRIDCLLGAIYQSVVYSLSLLPTAVSEFLSFGKMEPMRYRYSIPRVRVRLGSAAAAL
jgi:hypothetical protein